MRSATCFAAVVLLALLANATRPQAGRPDPNVAATDPRSPAEERKALRVPPGFEVQLVAAEPDIHKPINIAFDDRGRLWVTDTVEYPFAAPPGRKPRDSVKVLEDFATDGRARKITTFADGLNIPIGVLPLPCARPQEALVHSIPSILRLRDAKGRGRADQREVAYGGFGYRDTHGMTGNFAWGFDGWVYACHGFANTSTIKGKDGRAITMNSGNVYRLRADGSAVQQYTWGQVNPFGLSFDQLGNLYSADCHSQPIYQLLRGAYYPSFGKPHDGLGFGPEMTNNYTRSTAVCGIAYYAANNFPPAYRDTVFVGDVVTNEVVQFRITWHGSSPWATVHDFLRSSDPWFRPVSIQLGPDGALYVADFYNRIIGHYEVPLPHPGRDRERGRIWRIVYIGKGAKGTPAPRTDWTAATVAELVKDLGHPNMAVRFKATNQLVFRGGKAGTTAVREALDFGKQDAASVARRAHGLWVLERGGGLDGATLGKAAKDEAALVRVHAQRVLSERGDWGEKEYGLARAALKDKNPHVRRAAADALGRHPSIDNVRPLLELRHAVPKDDTHLLHVVRMALRDQLRPAGAFEELKTRRWAERDAGALADVALGVRNAAAAEFLLAHLRHSNEPPEIRTTMVRHVARFGNKATRADLLELVKSDRARPLVEQAAAFRAVEGGTQERGLRLAADARAWGEALTDRLLASKNAHEIQAGIELAGLLKHDRHQAKLAALALSGSTAEDLRASALNALAAIDADKYAATLGRVLTDPGSAALRERCVELLARANRDATRAQLVAALPAAPARLQNAIAAGLAASREGAEKLLEAVAAGKASARLLQERAVALRLEAARLPELKARLAKLTRGLPPADNKVQVLLAARHKSFLKAKHDLAVGAKVYEKNCAICHQIGGKGSKIGPQLDGIGQRGLDRLLEDVLDPNRNVDQAFRTTTLLLKRGGMVSGLLLREEGAVHVLADAQGKEVRVAKKDVEERSVSQLSPMPANYAEQIPEGDFYHLMAYLLAQRPTGK
jgi:putative heme-binding domain-containing protein